MARERVLLEKIVEGGVQAVRRHANGRAQNDDIAVVCFGRLEPEAGPTTNVTRPATTAARAPA